MMPGKADKPTQNSALQGISEQENFMIRVLLICHGNIFLSRKAVKNCKHIRLRKPYTPFSNTLPAGAFDFTKENTHETKKRNQHAALQSDDGTRLPGEFM